MRHIRNISDTGKPYEVCAPDDLKANGHKKRYRSQHEIRRKLSQADRNRGKERAQAQEALLLSDRTGRLLEAIDRAHTARDRRAAWKAARKAKAAG